MKRVILPIILLLMIGAVLIMRIDLAMIRSFDPDEFAHIHWTWLIAHGYAPYRDFFFYLLPVFQWVLAPIFLLFPDGAATLMYSRYVVYGIYMLLLFVIFRITKKTTGELTTALVAALLFAVFPMTIDKTIDVRPDALMTLWYFLGVMLLVPIHDASKNPNPPPVSNYFFASFWIIASLLVMVKIVFAIPAVLILFIARLSQTKGRGMPLILLGGILPLALIGSIFLHDDLLALAYRAVTSDAFIVNGGKQPFSLTATLSPWPIVYLEHGGISIPWAVNMMIWGSMIIGIPIAIIKNTPMGIFSLLFIGSSIAFLIKFPVPYVQYFIPVSGIAAILSAIAITSTSSVLDHLSGLISKRLRSPFTLPTGQLLIVGIAMLCLYSFFLQTMDRQHTKTALAEQLSVVTNILKITSPGDTIYDMNGSYVFRPDGYFICCHPYNEFLHRFTRSMESLTASLIRTKTKYLVMDQKGYVFWYPYPSDLDYMLKNYVTSTYPKIYIAGASYRCIASVCDRLNLHGSPITLATSVISVPFEGMYTLTTTPPGQYVIIGNIRYEDGMKFSLKTTPYHFETGQGVTAFHVMIGR